MSEPNTVTLTEPIIGVANGYSYDVQPNTYTVLAQNLTHAIIATVVGNVRVNVADIGR